LSSCGGNPDGSPISFKFSERFQAAAKAIAHAVRVTANKGALMILRAIFWIGLVSLLTPHEPDLGLGRPGAGISLPAIVKSWAVTGLSRPGKACDGDDRGACAGGLGDLAMRKGASGRSLADVKAELDASIKARGNFTL
jgi:hypothetical protein